MVQYADVQIIQSAVQVTLRVSRTDQICYFDFCSILRNKYLPISLLSSYLHQRPKGGGPSFSHFDGLLLTRFHFSAVLSKAINFLDIKQVLRHHSFRIGGTTLLSQRNVDDVIRALGRWADNSPVFKRYTRLDKFQACSPVKLVSACGSYKQFTHSIITRQLRAIAQTIILNFRSSSHLDDRVFPHYQGL